MGALEATQPATTVHRSDRQVQLRAVRLNNTDQSGKHKREVTSQPEQSKSSI